MTSEPASTEPAPSAPTPNPAVGLIGLFAVILGGILMVVGFLGGIDAALNGSGGGAALYIGIFIVGGLLVVGGLIFGIVCLVKGRTRVLSVVTIVLALLPVIGVIVLWAAQLNAS